MGHHFSTDVARTHPQLDLTDIYAFESDLPGKTCFVLILNPKSGVDDPENFSDDAIYKFHLGTNQRNSDGPIYTVLVRSGVATLGLMEGSAENLGLVGNPIGETRLNRIAELPGDIRFWAGTVRDPFFGNQNGLRELREAFAKGSLDLDAFKRHLGESPFTSLVCSALVLEIPNQSLPPTIYYFASADWHDQGHWHRSNRVAYVLVPHLYLFSTTDEQRSRRYEHLPTLDDQYRTLAAETIEKYARMAGIQSDPAAYGRRIAQTILPDAVQYRIGSKAHYGVGGANGRKLSDDAMDAALSWVVGAPINDGVEQPAGRVSPVFPFVVPI